MRLGKLKLTEGPIRVFKKQLVSMTGNLSKLVSEEMGKKRLFKFLEKFIFLIPRVIILFSEPTYSLAV